MKPNKISSEDGIALVQVMVMYLVLLLMVTGVLQIIFGTHYMYARVKSSEEGRSWVEACMAQKNELWKGNPCGDGTGCDFSADKGPVVQVSCKSPAKKTDPMKVEYTVTWQ